MDWDVFVCHASEDKEEFVRPLARELQTLGLRVWYDEFSLTVGDSLRRRIDDGLARSRAGVVILSPQFFAKEWPQRELDGLVARETLGQKVVLPVWHNLSKQDVLRYSPPLADKLGIHSTLGPVVVAATLADAIRKIGNTPSPTLDARIPLFSVSPDATFTDDTSVVEIAVREAQFNADHKVTPPLQLTVCPEVLWRLMRDRDALEQLKWPWSFDVVRRLNTLEAKASLSESERQERLWLHSVESQVGEMLTTAEKSMVALVAEPIIRNSGYFETPASLLRAFKAIIGLAFPDRGRALPQNSVKLDVYRIREPELAVSVRVPRDVFDQLLEGLGTANPSVLTIRGGTYAADLPLEVLTDLVIPAVVLEVFRASNKIPSYSPNPAYLKLSDWFVGLG